MTLNGVMTAEARYLYGSGSCLKMSNQYNLAKWRFRIVACTHLRGR